MELMLAVISGSAVINAFVWLVVAGLIAWLLFWFVGFVGLPQPFLKVAQVLIALFCIVVCINALLGITGNSFIVFK